MTGPLWLGVDDTDSPRGGCTTFTLTEVVSVAEGLGIDLIGEPRLVRLNPNVPFKTRGNAALAARFGHGVGRRRRQGVTAAGPVWSFARGRALGPTATERLVEAAWTAVKRSSRLGEEGTDPVLVATDRPLPADLYRVAVSRLTDAATVERRLLALGATVRATGSHQGVVGASAAIAWPGRKATWELLSYRRPERWGRPREVSPASVRAAQLRYPQLFLCHDPRTRRLLVAPHTACPILFGLRSRDRAVLPRALGQVESEAVERWMVFRTNQGTGDHVVPRSIADLLPYDSALLSGVVRAPPVPLPGGHVRFELADGSGALVDCLVFEPTKTLPSVAADLAPGDRVTVWGGRGADPAFRVEGLRLVRRALRRGVPRPPLCPDCGQRSRSRGRVRGYRCPGCGGRFPPERAEWPERPRFPLGVYHPTPSARRHLAPLGPEGPGRPPGRAALATDLYSP